jgi:hypothetical protein
LPKPEKIAAPIDRRSQIDKRAGPAAETARMRILRDDIDRYPARKLVNDPMAFRTDHRGGLVVAFAGLLRTLRIRAFDLRKVSDAFLPSRSGFMRPTAGWAAAK